MLHIANWKRKKKTQKEDTQQINLLYKRKDLIEMKSTQNVFKEKVEFSGNWFSNYYCIFQATMSE